MALFTFYCLSPKLLRLAFIFCYHQLGYCWLKGVLGQEKKLFYNNYFFSLKYQCSERRSEMIFRKLWRNKHLSVCVSSSAAWPVATEFDSDEGLRDITFLWVSWKIAGWISRETKINLSSRDSCMSIVRNQRRTVSMKVTGTRSNISFSFWACPWWVETLLSFCLYTLTPNLCENPKKGYLVAFWKADCTFPIKPLLKKARNLSGFSSQVMGIPIPTKVSTGPP